MELNKEAKIWLWVVFVLNCAVLVKTSIDMLGVVSDLTPAVALLLTLSLAIGLVMVVGTGILLFKTKKIGFYLMVASQVMAVVLSLLAGTLDIVSIISAVTCPLLTYLFIKNQWEELG